MAQKDLVLLVQLGSPDAPDVGSVRRYLRTFLGDPRVVDLPRWFWAVILNLFILPFRPKKSAQAYARIYDPQRGFPLVFWTHALGEKMRHHLRPKGIDVEWVFIIGRPGLVQWVQTQGNGISAFRKILIVPLFPQYSGATTASVWDLWAHATMKQTIIARMEFLPSFATAQSFIRAQVQLMVKSIQAQSEKDLPCLVSFHGLPLARVQQKGDPYFRQCASTFYWLEKILREQLPSYSGQMHMCFQSRFGSEIWLGPATDQFALSLVAQGQRKLLVVCPSFVADCLETVDEIGTELGHAVEKAGGKLIYIPCVNDGDSWASDFSDLMQAHLQSGPTEQDKFYFPIPENQHLEKIMPVQPKLPAPMPAESKKVLKIIFLILFLDLVGFSIIFPLFPAMLSHYLAVDDQNFILAPMVLAAKTMSGGDTTRIVVLFGGLLGALYSILQFIMAPFWGSLSDRIGRKRVLQISLVGLAVSYLLWMCSGSFTLLVMARLIGGIMAGNISTASAVVADVTDKDNRSRGMAFIGIAFALGFVLGPAIGGISSMLNLATLYPQLQSFGINPFSAPAIIALCLSLLGLIVVSTSLPETLPVEKRGRASNERAINPLQLFRLLPWPGVNLTIFAHFIFLTLFSGMEFTLTFLALERLQYTSMQNAKIFIFVGVVLAFVQGGVVRRYAHKVGEKNMAIMGLSFLIPGLIILSQAYSSGVLFFGLTFLAIGSALSIPCFTSLVSLYSPPEEQGRSMGMFRSLGALSRAIGPLTAALLYWRFGAEIPYLTAAVAMLIPIFMTVKLPKASA